MADNLLYFPYIDIPRNNWTIKSLLYWDNVGIIVPPDYVERPNQFDRYTIDLLQTDLITQVFPGNYTYQVKNFDRAFLKLVHQDKFNIKKRREAFQKAKYSRIHVEKFGRRLMEELVELRIAKRKDWLWFDVERKTARLLMLYLATIIAKVGNYMPATDDIDNLDTSLSQTSFSYNRYSVRQRLIDDLIPYPLNPALSKLRKFKDRHHEELTSFRILLEKVAFEISTIRSRRRQEEKHNLVIAEINDKRAKILSDLNQSNFKQITFGTVCGLAGAVVGLVNDNKPLALFSFANAVYSALDGFDRKAELGKDFAYLALIDQQFRPKINSFTDS